MLNNTETTSEEDTTIWFHWKHFNKEDLSTETLVWLNWYNWLSEEEQLTLDSIPWELYLDEEPEPIEEVLSPELVEKYQELQGSWMLNAYNWEKTTEFAEITFNWRTIQSSFCNLITIDYYSIWLDWSFNIGNINKSDMSCIGWNIMEYESNFDLQKATYEINDAYNSLQIQTANWSTYTFWKVSSINGMQ